MDGFALFVDVMVVIITVVLVHESGHYLIGRLCGYSISMFSIGIGPQAIHLFTHAGTHFIISWIPVGGYIIIDDRTPCADDDPSFRRWLWRDVAVYAAGSLANVISALVLAIIYFGWWRNTLVDASLIGVFDKKVDLFIFGSMVLAVVNWLPIPPLDGGRIVFALVEIIRHRKLNPDVKENMILIGSVIILVYMIIEWAWFCYFLIWG